MGTILSKDEDNKNSNSSSAQGGAVIVLTGCSGNGISTFCKQLQRKTDFKVLMKEQPLFTESIYSNILKTVKSCNTKCMERTVDAETLKTIKLLQLEDEKYCDMVVDLVEQINKSPRFQALLEKEYLSLHVPEGIPYFFKNLERLRPPKYIPNIDDILRDKSHLVKTEKLEFDITLPLQSGKKHFKILALNGEHQYRKSSCKVINLARTDVLIFVSSLVNCFRKCDIHKDQFMIKEDLEYFKDLISSDGIETIPIFLCLNMSDALHRITNRFSIKACFNDYDGKNESDEEIRDYVKYQFLKIRSHHVYVHFTNFLNIYEVERLCECLDSIVNREGCICQLNNSNSSTRPAFPFMNLQLLGKKFQDFSYRFEAFVVPHPSLMTVPTTPISSSRSPLPNMNNKSPLPAMSSSSTGTSPSGGAINYTERSGRQTKRRTAIIMTVPEHINQIVVDIVKSEEEKASPTTAESSTKETSLNLETI